MNNNNNCELCKAPARIFCDSDQATLCWSCDAKVHSANFLVARHSRTLLCRTCLSPTPWMASGAALPTAASVCRRCATRVQSDQTPPANGDQVDNQVVPWSSPVPPPNSSTSECSSCTGCIDHHQDTCVSEPETTSTPPSLKRRRQDDDHTDH